jgi:hypothetical protein
MPEPRSLTKAELREITWSEDQQIILLPKPPVAVQFNPESLKVTLSNQKAGGDQRGGSATQYVGQGTSKLSFELWFDVTAAEPDNQTLNDVRELTKKVAHFIKPKKEGDKHIAPGVRFAWGTFWFDGTMDSLNETLEFFSSDGRPLRAQLSISLSQQEIQFNIGRQSSPNLGTTPPGTRPQRPTREGDTVQGIAGENGRQDQWQDDARRNNIEQPRRPPKGSQLDMNR